MTPEDFGRVTRRPGLVIGIVAGQWLLLPAAAWILILILPLPPTIAIGLVLLVACPAGLYSNYLSLIARADVALSITLTAISIAVGTVKMPLVSSIGFRLLLDESIRIDVPVAPMVVQLIGFLALPVALGMLARRLYPDTVLRNMETAHRIGNTVLLVTVIVILAGLRRYVVADLGWAVIVSAGFTAFAVAVGLVTSKLVRADHRQLRTIAIEFSCRNYAIMALVGLTVFDRPEFAAFALIVFLVQVPIILGGIMALRSVGPV